MYSKDHNMYAIIIVIIILIFLFWYLNKPARLYSPFTPNLTPDTYQNGTDTAVDEIHQDILSLDTPVYGLRQQLTDNATPITTDVINKLQPTIATVRNKIQSIGSKIMSAAPRLNISQFEILNSVVNAFNYIIPPINKALAPYTTQSIALLPVPPFPKPNPTPITPHPMPVLTPAMCVRPGSTPMPTPMPLPTPPPMPAPTPMPSPTPMPTPMPNNMNCNDIRASAGMYCTGSTPINVPGNTPGSNVHYVAPACYHVGVGANSSNAWYNMVGRTDCSDTANTPDDSCVRAQALCQGAPSCRLYGMKCNISNLSTIDPLIYSG